MRRNRIVSGIAAASAAVLMLSGFDSAMTVQQLQENATNAMSQMSSMTAQLDAGADLQMTVVQSGEAGASATVPIVGNFKADYQINMEPVQMQMNLDFSFSAMGQESAGNMEMYLVEAEDGTGTAAVRSTSDGTASEWDVSVASAEDMTKVKDAMKQAMSGDLSALNSAAGTSGGADLSQLTGLMEKYKDQIAGLGQIAPEAVEKNGKQCYEVTADISGDVLTGMVSDIMTASGQAVDDSTMQMVQAVIGGLRMIVTSDLEVDTYLPVYAGIDLSQSDFSVISQLLLSAMGSSSDEIGSVDISVPRLGAEITFDANAPVSVAIPEDALAAAGPQDDGQDENVENALGELLGGSLTGGLGGTDTTDDGTGDMNTGGEDYDLPDDGEDGPVQNADGTYLLEYTDWDGNTSRVNVMVPDGMEVTYGSGDYITFGEKEGHSSVSYSLYTYGTAEETVEGNVDTSYMDGDSDYSNVERTEVMQTALEDGRTVYYATVQYTYSGYNFGRTSAAVEAGDALVSFEIDNQDENFNFVPATEEEVLAYASMLVPAA